MKALIKNPVLLLGMLCLVFSSKAVLAGSAPGQDTYDLVKMAGGGGEYIDLTAHGNAPDWSLEVIKKGRKVHFEKEDGAGNYKYASLGPNLYRDKKTIVFNVPDKNHVIKVFVKGNACQDSVTGKLYETTVIVSYDGIGYFGCGDVTAD